MLWIDRELNQGKVFDYENGCHDRSSEERGRRSAGWLTLDLLVLDTPAAL
jgi:hypothetical protein